MVIQKNRECRIWHGGIVKLLCEGKLQFVTSLGLKKHKKKKRHIQQKMRLIPTDSSVTILVVVGINQMIRVRAQNIPVVKNIIDIIVDLVI